MSYFKNRYVLSFIFTSDCKSVWLIKKQKPEWQKGCLNGIGGKVELNEFGKEKKAAVRELKEEAGVDIKNLKEVGRMRGINNDGSPFAVDIFTAKTDIKLKTMEKEEVVLVSVLDVKSKNHIENVPVLIESCLYYLNGSSNFSRLVMFY